MTIALIKSFTDKPWRSPATYGLTEAALKAEWPVESINTSSVDDLRGFLDSLSASRGRIFAFNIAEYLDEDSKSGFLPSLLDGWRIPHFGSSARAVAVALDKAETKRVLSVGGIPTPQFFVADRIDPDLPAAAERIGYPLFVKPIREGGHIGIHDDSVVPDAESLLKAVERIVVRQRQPALVEKYIAAEGMREFSVGVLDGEKRLFAPIEIDWEAMDVHPPILSHSVAMNDLERVKLVADGAVRNEIVDLADRTFDAVGAGDYSRIDIRMNATGFYVLEINAMPGLGPHSFLPAAAEAIHGIDYSGLIRKLTRDSLRRHGLPSL